MKLYVFQKIVQKNNISKKYRKIIKRYRKIIKNYQKLSKISKIKMRTIRNTIGKLDSKLKWVYYHDGEMWSN